MPTPNLETPVLFIIFNRPDTTRRVFEAIRAARPRRLFIAADGPRPHKPGEAERCEATRAITEIIDWPCEVARKYEAVNLGCKQGVSSAITWFFNQVEQGIILEDDCLPHPTFFSFSTELLTHYADQPEVMMISGDNLLPPLTNQTESYYFSKYAHIWGWASWRRAWQRYDGEMSSYPEFKRQGTIKQIFPERKAQYYWTRLFDRIYAGAIDTWDAQWQYAIFRHGGLSITPAVNLISNIGFGPEATHTTHLTPEAALATAAIGPLRHPQTVGRNEAADRRETKITIPSWSQRLVTKLTTLFHAKL